MFQLTLSLYNLCHLAYFLINQGLKSRLILFGENTDAAQEKHSFETNFEEIIIQ
ncbi:MAG: hypothetical protein K940chlam9_01369 [Chlamydiae bacterium]|nr:hypothetical protein [Chlamydiota bacterium]